MKNDVHLLYETSDGERFGSKEDADKHELNWALQQVLKEEINTGFEDLAKALRSHFDIHFKGEIVRLNIPKFVPGDYIPMQVSSYTVNAALRDEIKALKELLAKKEDIINRLHNQIHNHITGDLDD